MRRRARRIWLVGAGPCGIGKPAHSLNERHRDLIRVVATIAHREAVSAAPASGAWLACRSGLFWRPGRTGATGRPRGRRPQPAQPGTAPAAVHVGPARLPGEVRRVGDGQQVEASAEGRPGLPPSACATGCIAGLHVSSVGGFLSRGRSQVSPFCGGHHQGGLTARPGGAARSRSLW
jgi:hypothetical protein